MSKTTLDETLEQVAWYGSYKRSGDEPEGPTLSPADAKQAVLRWVADEVIGMDEPQTENGLLPDRVDRRNQIRSEQRRILAQHGYKGGER